MATAVDDPRVLVVEDNFLLAEALCQILSVHGVSPVGPAATVAAALRLVDESKIDAAVLDVRLHSDMIFPVCKVLQGRGIPFIFATGSMKEEIPAVFATAAVVTKPYKATELMNALNAALSRPCRPFT